MLKVGQKVQVASDATLWNEEGHELANTITGKITIVTGYAGKMISYKTNKLEDYYDLADFEYPASRAILFPIDDSACDAEFLTDFKEIIKEKVT